MLILKQKISFISLEIKNNIHFQIKNTFVILILTSLNCKLYKTIINNI